MLYVCGPCVGAISGSYLFRHVQTIFCWLDVCFRCLFSKKHTNKKQKSRFTDCVSVKNGQSPRNLAFSVCRTTFPRFSDSSGSWATSTMDPSAARILDPSRRSRPRTKPPSSAYTLRMKGLFLFEPNALFKYLFSGCSACTTSKRNFVETDFVENAMIFFWYFLVTSCSALHRIPETLLKRA